MTTININVTSLFINILLFFILYNITYWWYTLNDSESFKKQYRASNVIASLFMTTVIILLGKVIYYIYSHSHFTFTF